MPVEDITEILDEFKREIMPVVRAKIKELKTEYADDWQRERRVGYLMTRMEDIVYRTMIVMHNYDVAVRQGDNMDTRLFLGGQVVGGVKTIQKLQAEIIYLKHPGPLNGKGRAVTDEMIERAREFPFQELLPEDLKRGRCRCPIHAGSNQLSFSVKDNRGKCFSCGWPNGKSGDPIQFLMDTQGITFHEAIRRLQ